MIAVVRARRSSSALQVSAVSVSLLFSRIANGPLTRGLCHRATGSVLPDAQKFTFVLAADLTGDAAIDSRPDVSPASSRTGNSTTDQLGKAHLTFTQLADAEIASGVAVTPPLLIAFVPPSEVPVACEVLPAQPGVVVQYGSALVTSNATFPDLSITAPPGSTVGIQVSTAGLYCSTPTFTH